MSIKVISAFIASAGLTLVSTMLCLLLNRKNGARKRDGTISEPQTFNFIDGWFRKNVCQKLRNLMKSRGWDPDLYADCAKSLVETLSDQQLVTGIAVLVAAVKGLRDRSITVYHFTIVTDLAWFSSNTHLLSLLVRRSYDVSAKGHSDGQEERRGWTLRIPIIIRAALMLLLAALLLYTCWVSGYRCWYEEFRCPALCTLLGPKGGVAKKWMIVNFVLVLYVYPVQMLELSLTARKFWIKKVRGHILPEQYQGVLPCEPRMLWTMTFFAVWNLLASEFFAALELIAWFVLGCIWIVQDRASGHDAMTSGEVMAEDTLGFGQLVPVLLLVLPFIQLLQTYASKYADRDLERRPAAKSAIPTAGGNVNSAIEESDTGKRPRRVWTV